MGRKILKVLLWAVVSLVGLIFLLILLVYLPPVQNLVINKASSAAESAGIQLSVERFRLKFPLTLEIDNMSAETADGDMAVRCTEMRARVALLPLLRKQVRIRAFSLNETGINYRDTVSGMSIIADLDKLSLDSANASLGEQLARVASIRLDGGKINLSMGPGSGTEDNDTTAIAWKIGIERLLLNEIDFRMSILPDTSLLTVILPGGNVEEAEIDLGNLQASVERIVLDRGNYAYLVTSAEAEAPPVADTVTSTPSEPWTIRVGAVELRDNAVRYGSLHGNPRQGFDPDHIELVGLNLRLDSIYNRSTDVAATIAGLSFRERSGLEVTEARGHFSMDTARIRLAGFALATANSRVEAEALAGTSIMDMSPDADLEAQLSADLGSGDLFLFYPADADMKQALQGKSVTVEGKIAGMLDALDVQMLRIEMPEHIRLLADGHVSSITRPENMAGDIRFDGELKKLEFLKAILPDSMRDRIDLPDLMTLDGTFRLAGQTYSPDVTLRVDTGRVHVAGDLNIKNESYKAALNILDFPLYRFLPQDSLGSVTLTLSAEVRGFDPRKDGAAADIDLDLTRFDYNGYTYHDIRLAALLEDHLLSGKLESDNEALQVDFDLEGEIRPEKYAARLTGKAGKLDLAALNFAAEPLGASFLLDASVSVMPDTVYSAELLLDSARITYGSRTQNLNRTTLKADANTSSVTANLLSGDLSLDFEADGSLDTLLNRFTLTAAELRRQIDSASIDMAQVQQALPDFRLEASAGQDNPLHAILQAGGTSFREVNVSAATDNASPFHAGIYIGGLTTGNLTLDTINVGMRRTGEKLDYELRLANRPGNIETLALLNIDGSVLSNTADINILQRNRADSVGFRFGLEAELRDSALQVTMTPERPVLGYVPWDLNPGNYITYRFDKKLFADLRLDSGEKHVYIQSAPMRDIPQGAVRVDMAGIGIANALELLLTAPPVDGKLSSDITFGMDGNLIAASGAVGVDSLSYESRKVGNIGARISFESDSIRQRLLDAELFVDNRQALTAQGTYISEGENNLDFRVSVPSFPLAVANAFLPADAARLEGALEGDVAVTGSVQRMNIDGHLQFAQGRVTIPMIGTSYGLSPSPVVFDRSIVRFDGFGLTAPGNKALSIDGTVDVRDFNNMAADISLFGDDFPLVNSERNRESDAYGKANADIDIRAAGPVDALRVRGDVRLLNTTDVVYTLRDSPLEIKNEKQDIVTFVSFADTAALSILDSLPAARVWGIDMLVNVDIDEGVQATLNLSEDGNNRIELIGDGNLTYVMNTQGDSRFSGRYTLSGGLVVYNPPVISQKNFSISPDSYVEWTDDIANPYFNITATQTVQTTVTGEDQSTRNVTFNIIVSVRNSLENIEIVFDLAAPNDQVINNQLLALAPEQRSTQALALMVYNTYTGPGTTAKIDANNPLNSFLEKELNQWARNNLKNVDLSFGVQTVSDLETGGEHTDFSYSVSKNLFSDRVKVTIGGSVSSDATSQDVADDLVNDIALEYRLNKRDNMFLKVYRYNTQPSILEGEVVETGVGFVTRKKLNKFGDLFRFTRGPERRRMRQEKRALRQQIQDEKARDDEDTAKEQRQDNPLTEPDGNE